jgi:hypothetical protein
MFARSFVLFVLLYGKILSQSSWLWLNLGPHYSVVV